MLQKNDLITARFTGYTSEGRGVCRAPDGMTVFVPDAIRGELAQIRIDHVGRSAAFGHIHRLEELSPHRVQRACPLGKRCGGCVFWHMDYAEELRLKAQRVRDALSRIGGCDPGPVDILGAEDTLHYRNKAVYQVASGPDGPAAGFYQTGTHQVIPVERCLIQMKTADRAKDAVLDWMRHWNVPAYEETGRTGVVRHIFVRTALATGQVLVCVTANADALPHADDLVARLRLAVPGLKTVVLSVYRGNGGAVLGDRFVPLWGDGTIEDRLCGHTFRLSARSFYQVNPVQAQRLYERAVALAGLTGRETALDLYCGAGTITLSLARSAKKVYGVEVVEAAVADARENAARNQLQNVEFFRADAGQAAQRLADQGVRPDVILVDPPRKGLSPDAVSAMLQMAPRRIVYVSCDPATLARDVKHLTAGGYALRSAEALDMFPRCAHVETAVLLSREKGEMERLS